MITNVNNSRSAANGVIPQIRSSRASSTPNFTSIPADSFVKTIAEKDVPIPIGNAISKALDSISKNGFEEFEQALLKEDSLAGIKDLYLKAKKINENKINLKIVYKNDEGKGDGGFIIASGSTDAVKEEVRSSTFMSQLREKLGHASDDEINRPTNRLED